ncbi:MAG TPA: DUF4352 domain-containing protein [Candidatus Woesebacteria bacterium]|nr:DUF4352 domain-containing protein [Candidatus Woesebacteria bacterium]
MSDSKEKKGNWFMRHKILTGILVFIVFIVVVSASGGDSSPSGSSSSGSKQEQSQKQEKITAKIGEQVQSGDLAFTVNGVKDYQSLGNSFTSKDAQGVFKVVSLKIENVGKETKTIDSSMIKLMDSEGRTFERSIDGQTAKGLSQGQVDLFLQQVQPGLSVNGEIVFDIPETAQGLVIELRGGLFATPAEVELSE